MNTGKRITPEERARRKRRNRLLILAFFAFVCIIVVLESPLTRVRSISVGGNKSVTTNQVITDSGLKTGMSLWQVNGAAVNAAIQRREPIVDSVAVRTDFLHGHVTLQVDQKNVVAIFVQDGKFFNLLADGTVYNEINGNSGFSLPILTVDHALAAAVGKRIPDKDVVVLCNQLAEVKASDWSQVSQIRVDRLGIATLYLMNGFEVELPVGSFATRLPQVSDAVTYFLNKGYQPGVLDMSGQPPYLYTPFQTSSGKGKSH